MATITQQDEFNTQILINGVGICNRSDMKSGQWNVCDVSVRKELKRIIEIVKVVSRWISL